MLQEAIIWSTRLRKVINRSDICIFMYLQIMIVEHSFLPDFVVNYLLDRCMFVFPILLLLMLEDMRMVLLLFWWCSRVYILILY